VSEGLQAPNHAIGRLRLPEGVGVIEGSPNGARRAVGVVVGRFNGEITSKLLDGAISALEEAGVVTLPGSAFGAGAEGFFRIALTVGTPRLGEAAERLGKVLAAV